MKFSVEIETVRGGFVARVADETEPIFGSTPRVIAGLVREEIQKRLEHPEETPAPPVYPVKA